MDGTLLMVIVRVATLRRGAINPPEPLDPENAKLVEEQPWREEQDRLALEEHDKAELWVRKMSGST